MFDPVQARKEIESARRWADLQAWGRGQIQRTCSIRLWGDAEPDTLFTKNRNGEWCRIGSR